MRIEVGEYVRTNMGIIFEFQKIDADSYMWGSNYKGCYRKDIANHSKNIFELLESEDIVVLEYYVSKYRKRIKRRFEVFKAENLISFSNAHCDFLYDLSKQKFVDGKGFNPKLKGIVTKENFEYVEYKV